MKHKHKIIIITCVILIAVSIYYNWYNSYNNVLENFENIPENIGNVLVGYFHGYSVSICNQTNFTHNIESSSDIIKYLPTNITFDPELYSKFNNSNITLEKLTQTEVVALWHCDKDWIIDLWTILKPKIHSILSDALSKSGLSSIHNKYPIIHLRCADVPFSKHRQYFLQRYDFFKDALSRVDFSNNPDKTVVITSCSTHLSWEREQESCSKYVKNLMDYLDSEGYNCITQCKTNVEDFVDIFYAPFVISTGGSFSFISGFFGDGEFVSTEHKEENKSTCNNSNCNRVFIKGYNISHSVVDSYYDVDSVYKLLT